MSRYVGPGGGGEILFQTSLSKCHGMPDLSSVATDLCQHLGRHPGLQPDVRQYLQEEGGNPVAVFAFGTIIVYGLVQLHIRMDGIYIIKPG
jgi:hypothetical protein